MSFVVPPVTEAALARRSPVFASMPYDAQVLAVTTVAIEPGSETVDCTMATLDLVTGAETALGEGYGATWSPWGRRLAWLGADAQGHEGIVVREPDGQTWVVAGSAKATSAPSWSPDGAVIAFAAPAVDPIDRTQPFRWSRPVAAFDGTGPLEAPPQIWLAGAFGDPARPLTHDDWRWSVLGWSPDAQRLAAASSQNPDGSGGQRLHILGRDGEWATPTLPGGRGFAAEWLDDNRLAVLVYERHDQPAGADVALFIVEHGEAHEVSIDPDSDFIGRLGGDVYGDQPAELIDIDSYLILPVDADELLVRTVAHGAMGIHRAKLKQSNGAWSVTLTPLVTGSRSCTPIGFSNGRVVFATVSPDRPVEIATLDWYTGEERQVTSYGTDPTVTVERFSARTDAPAPIDAWCLRPIGAKGALPAVVLVHGGPHYAYGESYMIDAQALCAAGFAVIYANPRGSTGTSSAFAAQVHGDWAHGPSRDLEAVVDEATQRGWIDGDRVGIAGNSYGGYLAAWLGATTDRFRAAVAENPVTDLVGMYYTSDIGPWFFTGQFGGSPLELPKLYRDQSPLTFARESKTPMLFVTGDQDRRCPAPQVWAMHRQILAGSGVSEVVVLPGSSHEGSTYGPPAVRRAHDGALVDWMERWL